MGFFLDLERDGRIVWESGFGIEIDLMRRRRRRREGGRGRRLERLIG